MCSLDNKSNEMILINDVTLLFVIWTINQKMIVITYVTLISNPEIFPPKYSHVKSFFSIMSG